MRRDHPIIGTVARDCGRRTNRNERDTTMRKIIAGLFISLDGVMGAPDKWQMPYFNDEMGATVGSLIAAGDTLLLGRRTYQEFADAFADKTGDPNADRMNDISKLVVSTTLDTVAWQNSALLKGDVAEELTKLKRQPGGTINISGSATLIQSLLRDNLLDEMHLLVHPVIVGSGKRLFEDGGDRIALTLVDSQSFSTGVLYLTYQPAGA